MRAGDAQQLTSLHDHTCAGGIALAVLAVGSVNPGLLQFAIDQFRCGSCVGHRLPLVGRMAVQLAALGTSAWELLMPPRTPCAQPCLDPSFAPLACCSQVFPDYKERVVRHEAAHFLTGEPCDHSCTFWCRAACQQCWTP